MWADHRGELAYKSAEYMKAVTKALWRESGFELVEEMREGMRIIRPDYFVLRVSILGITHTMLADLRSRLLACKVPGIAELRTYSARKLVERAHNENDGEEKKYVNIAGGTKRSLEPCVEWLASTGFGRFGRVVPGPLLRATEGKRITNMPLQPGSAYAHLSKAMEKAYFASRAMGDDDQELDLGNHEPDKPRIGHHWARRKADQVARDTRDVTNTSEELIDEYFGWNQKQAKRKQQLHYAGSAELLKLARVTMML